MLFRRIVGPALRTAPVAAGMAAMYVGWHGRFLFAVHWGGRTWATEVPS